MKKILALQNSFLSASMCRSSECSAFSRSKPLYARSKNYIWQRNSSKAHPPDSARFNSAGRQPVDGDENAQASSSGSLATAARQQCIMRERSGPSSSTGGDCSTSLSIPLSAHVHTNRTSVCVCEQESCGALHKTLTEHEVDCSLFFLRISKPL